MKKLLCVLTVMAITSCCLGLTVFGAEDYVTRGEFADAVAGLMENDPYTGVQVFSDVDNSSPYFDAVSTLYAIGAVKGNGLGCFMPDAPITYKDAFMIAARLAAPEEEIEALGGYFIGGAVICSQEGFTAGISCSVTDNMTAEHMQRLLQNIGKSLKPGTVN